MGNRFAQAYGLTVLSPILEGSTRGVVHAAEIRAVLARLGTGTRSPFAAVPQTHDARWVVLDDLISLPYPAKPDHLRSKYLLFVADFDGDREPFLQAMCEAMGETVEAVWSHCVGFPGAHDWRAFRDYIAQCQIRTTFMFGGYPGGTVPAVMRALQAQYALGRFMERSAGLPSGELQSAFRELMNDLERAPLPSPGSSELSP